MCLLGFLKFRDQVFLLCFLGIRFTDFQDLGFRDSGWKWFQMILMVYITVYKIFFFLRIRFLKILGLGFRLLAYGFKLGFRVQRFTIFELGFLRFLQFYSIGIRVFFCVFYGLTYKIQGLIGFIAQSFLGLGLLYSLGF